MKVILASGSPRRRELLERAGLRFEVRPSPAEELHDASMALAELCEHNAELKARAVSAADAVVIGADTLVHVEGVALGKPADLDEARVTLRRLSGRAHTVCTGVCLVFPDGRSERFHALTDVRFRELEDGVIARYFELVDPLDKAGAYGIQEHGDLLVESIEGSFENVMGLPVDEVMARLETCRGGES